MQLRNLIAGAVFALALAACSTASVGGLTPPDRKPTIAERYLAARLDLRDLLTAAIAYAEKPRCSELVIVACSSQSVIDRLYDGLTAADASLDAVGAGIVAGQGETQGAALQAAVTALAALQAILVAEINKGS